MPGEEGTSFLGNWQESTKRQSKPLDRGRREGAESPMPHRALSGKRVEILNRPGNPGGHLVCLRSDSCFLQQRKVCGLCLGGWDDADSLEQLTSQDYSSQAHREWPLRAPHYLTRRIVANGRAARELPLVPALLIRRVIAQTAVVRILSPTADFGAAGNYLRSNCSPSVGPIPLGAPIRKEARCPPSGVVGCLSGAAA